MGCRSDRQACQGREGQGLAIVNDFGDGGVPPDKRPGQRHHCRVAECGNRHRPRAPSLRESHEFTVTRLRFAKEAVAGRGDGSQEARGLADDENLSLRTIPGMLDLARQVHCVVELARCKDQAAHPTA
jgi:hypothetical protein